MDIRTASETKGAPVDVLADYVTPASVDAFGSYPGKGPGDRFEVMYHGKVYQATVQAGAAHQLSYGPVLRNIRFQQVEGPVSRMFTACPIISRAAAATSNKKGRRHGIA